VSKVTVVLNALKNGAEIDGAMIAALVQSNRDNRKRMTDMHGRYIGSKESIPVFSREFLDQSKINSKLNNDFFSDIVDTKVGYLLGIPIGYTYREPEPDETTGQPNPIEMQNKKIIDEKLQDFARRENLSEVDAETAKFAAMCGYGARLCYVGEDGDEHIQNVYPWECIFLVDDNDIQRPEYAMRYWEEEVPLGESIENTQTIYKAEFYDSQNIYYFTQVLDVLNTNPTPTAAQTIRFVLDPDKPKNPEAHMFATCPLIGFPNNDEMIGDCDKVLSLIDAYDRTLSDLSSELEQMRLAYMAIYGVRPDDDFLAQIKKTGTIGFDDPEDRVEFIQKNLNDSVIENHLNRLCEDIYYFSGSPNFRDQAFAGNISGVALKFKLFKLESKCISAEREFQVALHQMFDIIGTKWLIEAVDFEPDDVEYKFKRNFPLNLADEASTTSMLAGLVSEETRLKQLSFVPDAKKELELMKAEQAQQINLQQFANANGQNGQMPQDQSGQTGQPAQPSQPAQNQGTQQGANYNSPVGNRQMDYTGVK
jgi:SPP1 family phage portal protein